MVLTYLSTFSGVLATPSSIPSAYPFTAVIGVFKSCAILLINTLFSDSFVTFSSAFFLRRARICSNAVHSSPISPSLGLVSSSKSRLPSLIFSAAIRSLSIGVMILLYIHTISMAAVVRSINTSANAPSIKTVLTSGITHAVDVTM